MVELICNVQGHEEAVVFQYDDVAAVASKVAGGALVDDITNKINAGEYALNLDYAVDGQLENIELKTVAVIEKGEGANRTSVTLREATANALAAVLETAFATEN